MKKRVNTGWCVCALMPLAGQVSAQEILLREGQTNTLPGTFTVPFAFYSDSLGPSVGLSAVLPRSWTEIRFS